MYTAWVLLHPAEDLPGAWVAHALDFDVVTHGDSPEHAAHMVIEAVAMVLEEDLAQGEDPYLRRAPAEFWERLHFIMQHGETLPVKDLLRKAQEAGSSSGCELALQMWFKESWRPTSDEAVPSYRVPLGLASQVASAHPC